MTSRLPLTIFAAIFVLGAMPLLLMQPSGTMVAGLNAGFLQSMGNLWQLTLFAGVGLWAMLLSRESMVMLPLGFLLLLTAGAADGIDATTFPALRGFMWGALLLCAAAIAVVRQRSFVLSVAILGPVAFHLGKFLVRQLPPLAPPLFYLLGFLIGAALCLAIGISIGAVARAPLREWFARLRDTPRLASFFSLF